MNQFALPCSVHFIHQWTYHFHFFMVTTVKYHACIKVSGIYCKYWKGLHKVQVTREWIERITNYWPIQWFVTFDLQSPDHMQIMRTILSNNQRCQELHNNFTDLTFCSQTVPNCGNWASNFKWHKYTYCLLCDRFVYCSFRPLPQYTDIPYYQKLNTSWFLREHYHLQWNIRLCRRVKQAYKIT